MAVALLAHSFSSMVRVCLVVLLLAASAALGAAPFQRSCCQDAEETPTSTTERDVTTTTTSTLQDSARGRERKMAKILVPLILGFKLAGAIVVGVSLVKLFLVKALILSKVALLSAVLLLLKKLLSSLGTQQHHPYLFAQQPLLYHHQHQEQLPYAQYPDPVHGYGYSAAGAALAGGGGVGLEDQQALFSEQVLVQTGYNNNNNTARVDDTTTTATTPSSTTAQQKNRIPMVKSFTNRAPVLAYRKVVSTGRQAAPL